MAKGLDADTHQVVQRAVEQLPDMYTEADVDKATALILNIALESAFSSTEASFAESIYSSIGSDLKAEDADWTKLWSGVYRQVDMGVRKSLIHLCRKYATHDGNCRQIIALYQNFALGRGIYPRIDSDQDQKKANLFINDPVNRNFFTLQGQRNFCKAVLVDGEKFLAFEGAKGRQNSNTLKIRSVEALEVTDFLVNPNDREEVWGYLIEKDDEKEGQKYILQDIFYEGDKVGVRRMDGTRITGIPNKFVPNLKVRHVVFDKDFSDGRGIPMIISSITWVKAHRHFMRARLAIQQALAMFPRKIKADAAGSRMSALASQFSVDSTDGTTTPRVPSGSTWWENKGVSLEPIKQDTGAESAKVDGAQILQQAGIGAGIFSHYLGSSDSYRLATAGAMEPPMVKAFEAFQQMLIDEYRIMFQYLLMQHSKADAMKVSDIDFDAPQIHVRDSAQLIHAINEFTNVFGFKKGKDVVKLILKELSVNNITEVADRLIEDQDIEDTSKPVTPTTQPGDDPIELAKQTNKKKVDPKNPKVKPTGPEAPRGRGKKA